VLLRDEARKAPIATLAACVALFGGGIKTAIEFWSDKDDERCDIKITAPISNDTNSLARDVLAQLPPGCSIRIDLRALTPSEEQSGVAVKIEPLAQPRRQTEYGEVRSPGGLGGIAPPVAKGVTYERILNAREEPQNWLTYYGAYDGQRFSPLDQINTGNVKRLTPAWVFQAGSMGLHSGASTYAWEASPLVVDGVMFVSGWDGQLWALDARNGQELWRYKHASPFDVSATSTAGSPSRRGRSS